jgi:hypothetical protein
MFANFSGWDYVKLVVAIGIGALVGGAAGKTITDRIQS